MGNHGILWIGAASGSRTLVATVLSNSIYYNNLEVVEAGYGISLRPLSVFANEVYRDCDVSRFAVKITEADGQSTEKDKLLSARMHKAITVILFKLEGQKIFRHPEYNMTDRLLLDKIDYDNRSITIDGKTFLLEGCDFPTVDRTEPYVLTEEENSVIDQLTASFLHSEKLQRHVRFLYSKGSLYKTFNGNLLYRGCIPMGGWFLSGFLVGREETQRQGVSGLCGCRNPAGLLSASGLGGTKAGDGFSLVFMGWAQQPHLWEGPNDNFRAAPNR